ncbi:MAG: DUF2177 family protein [Phycisphaerae bacterium]|nr:DUF2177 family protein [Phycisphaerae bacterium]NNF42159.1 DUF2177 family protein [Phycisphaerales bacterium]
MSYVKCYAGVILAFLVIDLAWIVFVAKPLYERTVGDLMRASPNLVAAGVFYLAYAAGIVVLACRPAMNTGAQTTALVNGAVLGALAYGSFTVTNYALFKAWTTTLVVTDILWGTALTAVSAWIGLLATRL